VTQLQTPSRKLIATHDKSSESRKSIAPMIQSMEFNFATFGVQLATCDSNCRLAILGTTFKHTNELLILAQRQYQRQVSHEQPFEGQIDYGISIPQTLVHLSVFNERFAVLDRMTNGWLLEYSTN
jgi:hypothetical protein